jgi:hypothetical protein
MFVCLPHAYFLSYPRRTRRIFRAGRPAKVMNGACGSAFSSLFEYLGRLQMLKYFAKNVRSSVSINF